MVLTCSSGTSIFWPHCIFPLLTISPCSFLSFTSIGLLSATISTSQSSTNSGAATEKKSRARIIRGPPSPLPAKNIKIDDPAWRERLGLNWVSKAKKKTVPPTDAWVSEDPETTKLYEEYVKQRALKDGRISRKFIYEVDPEEWRHVIRLDESAIIVDADTGKEELIVVRRALGNEATLQEAQKVAMR